MIEISNLKKPYDYLHKQVTINLDMSCDICGHTMLFKVVDEYKIRIIPCKHCYESGHISSHKENMEDSYKKHELVITTEHLYKENELKKLEEKISKKFEKRFKELLNSELK